MQRGVAGLREHGAAQGRLSRRSVARDQRVAGVGEPVHYLLRRGAGLHPQRLAHLDVPAAWDIAVEEGGPAARDLISVLAL